MILHGIFSINTRLNKRVQNINGLNSQLSLANDILFQQPQQIYIKFVGAYKMAKVFGQLQLPRFFAEQMLECQIQTYLSQKLCPNLIRKSIQLYTTGLEYYESIRSSKYLYFKKKMEDLVKNPIIITEMNSKQARQQEHKEPLQAQNQLTNQQQQRRIEVLQIRQKCQRLHNDIIISTTEITSEKIRAILNQTQLKAHQTKEIIKCQISQQQKKLKQKIEQRKMKKQFKKTIVSIGNWGDKSTQDSKSIGEEQFDQIERTITDFEETVIQQKQQSNLKIGVNSDSNL